MGARGLTRSNKNASRITAGGDFHPALRTLCRCPRSGTGERSLARWRERDALLDELSEQGFDTGQVDRYDVPGAFEIPLLALKLARSGRYAAIVACALVVDGGIYRHEFVASAVIDGLMRAQLDSGVPIFSAVLTPQAFHEHEAHQRFFAEHMVAKGREVARTCMATLAAHGVLAAPATA